MDLKIIGHDDIYSAEQLLLALFPQQAGQALSRLSRGKTWLTATAEIEIDGKKATATRR